MTVRIKSYFLLSAFWSASCQQPNAVNEQATTEPNTQVSIARYPSTMIPPEKLLRGKLAVVGGCLVYIDNDGTSFTAVVPENWMWDAKAQALKTYDVGGEIVLGKTRDLGGGETPQSFKKGINCPSRLMIIGEVP